MTILVIHLKQLLIFVVLLTVSSLVNANLLQQNTALQSVDVPSIAKQSYAFSAHHNIQYTTINSTQFVLAINNPTYINSETASGHNSKMDSLFAKLFDYVSNINQTTDQEGLATFWKGTLITHAVETFITQNHSDTSVIINDNAPEMLQIAANSLNDQYTNDVDHVNEVPLPTAAWLFTSAIILFGFSRRNNI